MPAYDDSPWFALFFIVYIITNTYIFINLFLAVIYNSYRAHLKVNSLVGAFAESDCGQARSQDLEKGRLFWKSTKSANDLDPNFHCSWIRITRFVRKLRRNFSEARKFQRFFSPKTGGLQKKKKKKKVFTEIGTDFPAKIGNSNVFSAQKQVVSKKKRKKVFTESETDFPAKIGNS